MQNLVRYRVVNQDGQPVIRAVPVPRRLCDPLVRTAPASQPAPTPQSHEQHAQPVLRRIRLRLFDIR